jgi:hypothetical protein
MGIFPFKEKTHGRTGNRTRYLMISSQKLWPLDHEAGRIYVYIYMCVCVCVCMPSWNIFYEGTVNSPTHTIHTFIRFVVCTFVRMASLTVGARTRTFQGSSCKVLGSGGTYTEPFLWSQKRKSSGIIWEERGSQVLRSPLPINFNRSSELKREYAGEFWMCGNNMSLELLFFFNSQMGMVRLHQLLLLSNLQNYVNCRFYGA